MNHDIDFALKDWKYNPGTVQSRLVRARDGRQVVQLRLDLGILQMEVEGRPDGEHPHGFATYLDYLRDRRDRTVRRGGQFVLSEDECEEADREFVQYYHRRISWLALCLYDQAQKDAEHTLAFMDFLRDHSPSEEYLLAHEQYRGFVLFHHTQAASAHALKRDDPEGAIDAIRDGLKKIAAFFAAYEIEDQLEENSMVQQLRHLEQSLRQTHRIEATLQEQLEEAVANEDYEGAARLRDAIRRRQ
ncbi:MAG: UvrB/UvrC motif-containing protein [Gemmataceae bacterium]